MLNKEDIWKEDIETLFKRVNKKQVVLIDLRSMEEREYLPVNGVIVFDGELKSFRSYLQKISIEGKEVVLLCKGRMCERLYEAVNVCLRENIPVKALPLSAHELWKLQNLEFTTS